jgi:hypothetical protein
MADLLATLVELAVAHEDIDEVLAIRLSEAQRAMVDDKVAIMARHMGLVQPAPPRFQPQPSAHPLFYVLVYAAALGQVQAYHRARGVPESISRLTVADVGRNVAVHRRRTGLPGIDPPHWLQLHFCGTRYQIGRLQYEQAVEDGEPVLSIHIPTFCGPLSPAACDDSLRRAKAFFARHFPEVSYQTAVCRSWLLDSQLREYLPANSNILRFQRRFTPRHAGREDDESIQRFVLPGTPLHRKVIEHLEAGRHWRTGSGWLDF